MKKRLKELQQKNENIDLLVITHIDDDHIDGILAFVEDADIDKSMIKKYWFNSSKIISKFFNTKHQSEREIPIHPTNENRQVSIEQGITLEKFLENQNNKWHSKPILFEKQISTEKTIKSNTYHWGDIRLTILSPTKKELVELNKDWIEKSKKISSTKEIDDRKKEFKNLNISITYNDQSIANRSSIAFYLTYNSKNYLFLADAAHTVIVKSLKALGFSKTNKLKAEYVKLSHHGSKYNVSKKLLELIDCTNFIISTEGEPHLHPNKYTLALIINHYNQLGKLVNFHFNYDNNTLQSLFSVADKSNKVLKFKTNFPKEGETLKIELK